MSKRIPLKKWRMNNTVVAVLVLVSFVIGSWIMFEYKKEEINNYEKDVVDLEEKYERDISLLLEGHERDIFNINSSYSQEISILKGSFISDLILANFTGYEIGYNEGYAIGYEEGSGVARFVCEKIEIFPSNPHVEENITVNIFLKNIGSIVDTQVLECYVDDVFFEEVDVYLEPEEEKQISFSVGWRESELCNFSFIWDYGDESLFVELEDTEIDPVTGKYYTWIDGFQCSYQIGLVNTPDGFIVNSYNDYIVLINNGNAKDVSYSQILDFLKVDDTDEYPYQFVPILPLPKFGTAESNVDLEKIKNIIDGSEELQDPRICGDFAELVHNNAEKAGIRCAYVSIDLEDNGENTGHALVAFNATDKGLIYIDCTGVQQSGPLTSFLSCDKIVDVKVGQSYIPTSLFPEKTYGTTWGNIGTVTDIFITWDGEWRGA